MERDTGFMDWVDRVREQANAMAQKAQDDQIIDQEQWEEIKRSRRINSLLHDLGELVYRQETRGVTDERKREIVALIGEIKLLEESLTVIDVRNDTRHSSNA